MTGRQVYDHPSTVDDFIGFMFPVFCDNKCGMAETREMI